MCRVLPAAPLASGDRAARALRVVQALAWFLYGQAHITAQWPVARANLGVALGLYAHHRRWVGELHQPHCAHRVFEGPRFSWLESRMQRCIAYCVAPVRQACVHVERCQGCGECHCCGCHRVHENRLARTSTQSRKPCTDVACGAGDCGSEDTHLLLGTKYQEHMRRLAAQTFKAPCRLRSSQHNAHKHHVPAWLAQRAAHSPGARRRCAATRPCTTGRARARHCQHFRRTQARL